MTRLQKMLGQIKTVGELAEIVNVPLAHITMNVGVSKDNEHFIFCKRENCAKCAWDGVKGCTVLGSDDIISYLNAELPDNIVYADTDGTKITSDHTPVVKLRDSARKLIKTVIIEGFNQGHKAQIVYDHIDEYIDVLEGIGLFEEGELRAFIVTDLLEYLAKIKEERLKRRNAK